MHRPGADAKPGGTAFALSDGWGMRSRGPFARTFGCDSPAQRLSARRTLHDNLLLSRLSAVVDGAGPKGGPEMQVPPLWTDRAGPPPRPPGGSHARRQAPGSAGQPGPAAG